MRLLYCFLLGLMGLLVTTPSLGQTVSLRPPLSGHVVTTAMQPLAGVSVQVMGTALGTSTNADGLFLLEGVGAGTHTLRFDLPGHLLTDVVVSDTTRAPLLIKLHSTRPPMRPRRRP